MLVYKILHRAEWQALERDGELQGSPVDLRDGFVHLSNGAQVAETAARHFAGADDLVLLAFDAAALGAALRWEPSRGGALFPALHQHLLPHHHAVVPSRLESLTSGDADGRQERLSCRHGSARPGRCVRLP
jgi:uncharacterized protein (DUF952 family)